MLTVWAQNGWWWKQYFISVTFLPQIHSPRPILRKTNRQTPLEVYSTKYLTSTPQLGQGHLNKENLRNCHSPEEPKKIWWGCDVVSWMSFWNGNRTLDENWENLNNMLSLAIKTILIIIFSCSCQEYVL